MDYYKNISS